MALSLKAEQKNLIRLFETEDIYVIPAYQRPYSWEEEQCEQLYKDITNAFDNKEDYFLGNIIVARSKDSCEESMPHVIDGQQRLLTLFLIAKILTILCPQFKRYRKMLYVEDSKEENRSPKFVSKLYETQDDTIIQKISEWDDDEIIGRFSNRVNSKEELKDTKLYSNLYYFYKYFSAFKLNLRDSDFDEFVEFFFRRIYLLPIELDGSSIQEASEKALTIFETLNNRGMSLENADILKANLYENARNIGKQEHFILLWKDVRNDCNELGISIDDLFRYYYHVLRGKEGIVSPEKKLRDYFLKADESPLHKSGYELIMEDLNHIIDILQYIKQAHTNGGVNSIWFQIIDAYSNKYPQFALVAYLFHYSINCDESKLLEFLQSLIRCAYSKGSTTSIKFEIYNIIYCIFYDKDIPAYDEIKPTGILEWKKISPLRRGFALLALALSTHNLLAEDEFIIDRIINKRESLIYNSLGNLLVLDCAKARGDWSKKKSVYTKRISNDVIKDLLHNIEDRDSYIKQRDNDLKKILESFFNIKDIV